jgi:hypothetical protein
MGRRACTLSMMSLSSAGVIPTVQPLKVSVTLPCVRSTTGLHDACVRTACSHIFNSATSGRLCSARTR